MKDLPALIAHCNQGPLADWVAPLPEVIKARFLQGHGDLSRWQAALAALPALAVEQLDLTQGVVLDGPYTAQQRQQLEQALQELIPWRKGPFSLFGVHIDSEWRSDFKWARLAPHIDLAGKHILDVGCGNGYYLWRMLGAGAATAIGIDPAWLYHCQFQALRHYLPRASAWHLPLALEDLPARLAAFDTVFSMGVLYHRRSPIDHLLELRDCLRPGGELVLETLVIDGAPSEVLVPQGRYAQMRNVWFIPSADGLERWLSRTGYVDIRTLNVSTTGLDEQRSTAWMHFQSLADFLDPNDASLTIEGLPAPRRALLVARKPG